MAETSEWDRAKDSGYSLEEMKAAWLDSLRDEIKERCRRLVVLRGSGGDWTLEESKQTQ